MEMQACYSTKGYASLIGKSYKTEKSDKADSTYRSGITYLWPNFKICFWATVACMTACLKNSGHGGRKSVQAVRKARTKAFMSNLPEFMTQYVDELETFSRRARKANQKPIIRPNGTSDIAWENIDTGNGQNIFERFPEIQFYDYTKSYDRMEKFVNGRMPANYHLTFSWSGENQIESESVLRMGGSVAVVFRVKTANEFPATFLGSPVYDADKDDRRFLDKPGVQGLTPKGKRAWNDKTGFVVDV